MRDESLEVIRKKIDAIDNSIVKLLSRRWDLVKKAGRCKRERKIAYWQASRVKEVIKTRTELGKKLGLPGKFVKIMFTNIVKFAMDEERRAGGV